MSYFLFGTFDSKMDISKIEKLKSYDKMYSVFSWFNEEITFYSDICVMCGEQNSKGATIFALTSPNQPCNSSDLLFPYDKYSNEEIFIDNEGKNFSLLSEKNLEILFEYLEKMIEVLQIKKIDIFVVEGYDNQFTRKQCSLKEMQKDILLQIKQQYSIESCIYHIEVA